MLVTEQSSAVNKTVSSSLKQLQKVCGCVQSRSYTYTRRYSLGTIGRSLAFNALKTLDDEFIIACHPNSAKLQQIRSDTGDRFFSCNDSAVIANYLALKH